MPSLGHAPHPRADDLLTPAALAFVGQLEREFGQRRQALLADRRTRQDRLDAGERPDFLAETAGVRAGGWQVPPPPKDLIDRRVEITGPTERKTMINALNSGAQVFMADFEDALSPTWHNVIEGQRNVHDAVRRTISLDAGDRQYRLQEQTSTLVVRPRGWHLSERHLLVDDEPASASLVDVGLFLFHNTREALDRGSGPYLYLPKLEGHLEARLWNDVFCFAQDVLDVPRGSIRATVLVETVLAAFEMDEILFELGDHATGLNAGRWDYVFSITKKFAHDPRFVLPDRSQVTMTAPFMRAYTELLVATCHRRAAHAIGGMSAFIPNRRRPEVTERAMAQVADDKRREATDGFDGTWVAHPDLIEVARAEFDAVLGERPNQIERLRPDVDVSAADLLAVDRTSGDVTEAGLRSNVDVGLRYLSSWLTGTGAAAIHDLMEDAATAEISRGQVWQWVRHGRFTRSHAADVVTELVSELTDLPRIDDARRLFEDVALNVSDDDRFVDFLTLPAYQLLD